ncbi:MAG: isoprenylcysteine carboxylmethyltransferase family protein, partial [Campylobacteraceae bacterium]|nr:isoprenylcysteine carboxylmethyltransferase family protein [Campylobacteraceae bacterium]
INDSILNHSLSLLICTCGFSFGLYTLYYNRLGNFNISPEIKKNSKLIKNGAYQYIRHPMYFSVLIIMAGVILTNMNFINILIYILLIIVLYIKAAKEEKLWSLKLDEYKEYKTHTKMFVPFIL